MPVRVTKSVMCDRGHAGPCLVGNGDDMSAAFFLQLSSTLLMSVPASRLG